MPSSKGSSYENATVLEIQHAYSKKSSDCLAVCVNMVLQYYGAQTIVPDTALPLELMSLSRSLNSDTSVDAEGHVLFSTVLELTPEEIAVQLAKDRPLIVAYKPSGRIEYHGVVVAGFSKERGQFYLHDPSRHKPSWKKLSKISTFADSGKYLVMLVGLREK